MTDIVFEGRVSGLNVEDRQTQEEATMPQFHVHEYTELYFLLEGERYYFIEQNRFHVKPGMAVLITPEQIHKTSATDEQSGHRRFLLEIDSDFLTLFFSLSDLSSTIDFQERYCGMTVFSERDWKQVLSIIDMLKVEIANKGMLSQNICKLLVTQLLLLYVRNHTLTDTNMSKVNNSLSNTHTSMQSIVQDVSLYLQEHYAEEITLEEIANRFHMSKSSLTLNFKNITGLTINEFIRVCHIRRAKVLLLKTNLSITEIASQTGFGNVTYFERVFKNFYEMSPLKFRKQNYFKE